MSNDPYDERGGGGHDSRGERDPEDDTFAEVLNKFSFDSGRSRRKRRFRRDPERGRRAPQPRPDVARESGQEQPGRGELRHGTPEAEESGHEPFPEHDALMERAWPTEDPVDREPPQQRPPSSEPVSSAPAGSEPAGSAIGDQLAEPPAPTARTQDSSGAAVTSPPPRQSTRQAEDDSAAATIRPYTWTGGRTQSNQRFEMETLVSTSESYRPNAMLRGEHQSVAEMCRYPRSVAEVAALLSVPLGVAKVLLADMAELGLITVHHTVTESGSAPHVNLMERVLSGLRRL